MLGITKLSAARYKRSRSTVEMYTMYMHVASHIHVHVKEENLKSNWESNPGLSNSRLFLLLLSYMIVLRLLGIGAESAYTYTCMCISSQK